MPSDTTAPQLVSINLSDNQLNIGIGENSLDVTVRLTDDQSGVNPESGNFIRFVSPSGQFVDAIFARVSGSGLDGTYKAALTLGPFAEAGKWKVEWGTTTDLAGNIRWLYPDNSNPILQSVSFSVLNQNSDSSPPILQTLQLSDTLIEFAKGEKSFTVTARLTDNLSGANPTDGQFIRFASPSGQFVDAIFARVSGNPLDGVYKATVNLGAFAESGVWRVEWGTATDLAGNIRWLYPMDSTLLQSTTFRVTGSTKDTTPPTLASIDVGVPQLQPDGSSEFRITARLTDDLSGVNFEGGNFLRFVSSSGQFVDALFSHASGTQLDGIYNATIQLGVFAESGTWKIDWGNLVDVAGNIRWLYPDNTAGLESVIFVLGSELGDTLGGTSSPDAMYGFSGDDSLNGLNGIDILVGGDGDDTVDGGAGDDAIIGGDGTGDDKYVGGQGIDTAIYKSASKSIVLNLQKSKASGPEIGKDKLKQIEAVVAGRGNDTVKGNKGKNVLDGYTGKDKLSGGPGKDAFVFSTELGEGNVDWVKDFKPKDDIFHLDDAIFAGLAVGKLKASSFQVRKAKDANDRIIYDDGSGLLLFDANGSKNGGSVVFARVGDDLSITHKDFLVI